MDVKISTLGSYLLVDVEGRIDTTNASEFELKMMELIEGGNIRIILNCAGLNYISSSGLRVFLVIQKKMVALKGQFKLCNLQPGIREIFDISGFSSIFSVYPDAAAASAE
jgi:anti-anti-sigma factor